MAGMLIGLAGRARVGKDTAADVLVSCCGLVALSFAKPIKDGLAAMFGLEPTHLDGPLKERPIDDDLVVSPRVLMQTLGTDWGRRIDPGIWIWNASRRLRAAREFAGDAWAGAVFTDVRFENEAAWIRRSGGVVIHVLRDVAPRVADHASEAGVSQQPGDLVVCNNGSLHDLERAMLDAADLVRGFDTTKMQTFGALDES